MNLIRQRHAKDSTDERRAFCRNLYETARQRRLKAQRELGVDATAAAFDKVAYFRRIEDAAAAVVLEAERRAAEPKSEWRR
ncbi:MAG: hypothetical protein WB662_08610 [Methyloceanibacter sp.]